MCSILAVSHTQPAPPQQGSSGTEWEFIYSQAPKSSTQVVHRGDVNPVQGSGKHLWGGSGFTHSRVVFTPRACTCEFTLIPSLSSLMGGVVGSMPGQCLVPADVMAPANVTGWVGVHGSLIYTCQPHKPCGRPGLLPPLYGQPFGLSSTRASHGTSGPTVCQRGPSLVRVLIPSAQLGTWHGAGAGE